MPLEIPYELGRDDRGKDKLPERTGGRNLQRNQAQKESSVLTGSFIMSIMLSVFMISCCIEET